MRREILYLIEIVEAIAQIEGFVAGLEFQQFLQSDLIRSAVVQKLSIVGEAASRISPALRSRTSEVPWPQIVVLRNVLVQAYFGIDWSECGFRPRTAARCFANKSREFWNRNPRRRKTTAARDVRFRWRNEADIPADR